MADSTPAKFQKEISIRFREADPAGILFFGHVFSLAHDCFEDFIQAAGFAWKDWFHIKDHLIPIRHTECNYHKPFIPGEKYSVTATVARLGNSSFQMRYVFAKGEARHAEVLMTHTFLSLQTKEKISVPDKVRDRLKPFVEA